MGTHHSSVGRVVRRMGHLKRARQLAPFLSERVYAIVSLNSTWLLSAGFHAMGDATGGPAQRPAPGAAADISSACSTGSCIRILRSPSNLLGEDTPGPGGSDSGVQLSEVVFVDGHAALHPRAGSLRENPAWPLPWPSAAVVAT
jgi:hypothetical protein